MRDREVRRAKIDAARYAASHRAPADLLSRAARAVLPPSARARSPDRSPSRIIIQMHPPTHKALYPSLAQTGRGRRIVFDAAGEGPNSKFFPPTYTHAHK